MDFTHYFLVFMEIWVTVTLVCVWINKNRYILSTKSNLLLFCILIIIMKIPAIILGNFLMKFQFFRIEIFILRDKRCYEIIKLIF